jgi:hypothetical protein
MQGARSDERTGLESRGIHNHILLSHLRLGSLFVTSYDSQGYGGGILTRLHAGDYDISLKCCINTCSDGCLEPLLHQLVAPRCY